MTVVAWYIDFISPFSYLQSVRIAEVTAEAQVVCRPVLFAGLLKHWGQVGPAELAPKRAFTYRYCHWRAGRMGVPYCTPSAHPFNPLKALRLALALGGDVATVCRIFQAIWGDGRRPDDPDDWPAICASIGVEPDDARLGNPAVKQQLRSNGEAAIAAGVFGVPTLVVGGMPFWGLDATDFALEAIRRPGLMAEPEMQRLAELPVAAARRP